jgi:hypothetical protein
MYKKFKDFGSRINSEIENDFNAANPLTYCMVPSLNSQFFHGSSSSNQLYSNMNTSCTNFMAQRCSVAWDDYCEAFFQINTDNYWPNLAVVDQIAYQNGKQFFQINPTIGQDLLRNACYMKFIYTDDLNYTTEQFDPNVANSPFIKIFNEYVSRYSKVINLSDPNKIKDDKLVKRMLDNYQICIDVIARIYLAYLRKENDINLKDTPLEDFFKKNEALLNFYLAQAIELVPSFQNSCYCSYIK